MASDDEKNAIIFLTGQYIPTEWPWNKLTIAKERKQVRDMIDQIGDKNTELFIIGMMTFHELIVNELISVHGNVKHYDFIDGGKLSAILLMTDNFVQNQTPETASTLHNLIINLEINIYVPYYFIEPIELDANIIDDIWAIMKFLDDWCYSTGNEKWLPELLIE